MGKVKYDKLLGKLVLHTHDPLYLKDADGVEWAITVNTSGALVTTQIEVVTPEEGNPFGAWLWLTYP